MRFENLLQFIVPLTFLAIWALTSLFNRDAQPLPPRRPSGPGPEMPRREPVQARPVASDRPRSPDDGIVILEAETRRPNPTKTRGRSGRNRPERPVEEPTSSERLKVDMHRPNAPLREQLESLTPLAKTASPLDVRARNVLPEEESGRASRVEDLSDVQTSSVERLRSIGSDPVRLREAFLAAEVLFRPPVALRSPRRRPRQHPSSELRPA